MEDNSKNETLSGAEMISTLWQRRKTFFSVWLVTFALACLWILPQPRTYKAEVMLAPESGGETMGSIGALASSFGVDLGGEAADAIYPELYPDLMNSTDFIVSLFPIPVKTLDGEIDTDFYTYMTKHQKLAFYKKPQIWLKRKIKSLLPAKKTNFVGGGDAAVNPFFLTELQSDVVEVIRGGLVTCTVDKLTNVFTIRVVTQDPLVAATLADSIRMKLQTFITNYRTNKARVDVDHYRELMQQTEVEYERAVNKYSHYLETHHNVTSKVAEEEVNKLARDVERKYSAYNAVSVQLQATEAKLQEKTPAFTIVQNAYVPQKPAGPKRMLFVAFMLVLSTIVTAGYLLKKDMFKSMDA